MPCNEGMHAELDRLLALPVFVRSPVQARLLKFLVEAAEGDGESLNSYMVAVDGLGRAPDYDPQVDSYARVQVARLRRTLEAIYGPDRHSGAARLTIKPGSYQVQWIIDGAGKAAKTGPSKAARVYHLDLSRRAIVLAGLALILFAVLSALIAVRFLEEEHDSTAWSLNNFPTVDVSMQDGMAKGITDDDAMQIRQNILMEIRKYSSIRVSNINNNSDFTIEISKYGEDRYLAKLIYRKEQRILWSEYTDYKKLLGDNYIQDVAYRMAGWSGFIHNFNRQKALNVDNSYACWLKFTAAIQSSVSMRDNDVLEDCAEDWYENSPEQPLAAAIYGWVIVNSAIFDPIEAEHARKLDRAIEILRVANDLDPESRVLQISLMRALAFDGQRDAMRVAAHDAIKASGANLDIQGIVGVFLTLQHFPEGDNLIRATIEKHGNPPAWYFVGRTIAAMMREDLPAARRHLIQLRPLKHYLPVATILTAAVEARSGNLKQARSEWAQAGKQQPMLRWNPDLVLKRLPIAPSVRSKLKAWLRPVLH